MKQNRHNLLAFPKFNKAVFILPSEGKALVELFAIRCTQLVVFEPLWWRCIDCVIHDEWDVREEQ